MLSGIAIAIVFNLRVFNEKFSLRVVQFVGASCASNSVQQYCTTIVLLVLSSTPCRSRPSAVVMFRFNKENSLRSSATSYCTTSTSVSTYNYLVVVLSRKLPFCRAALLLYAVGVRTDCTRSEKLFIEHTQTEKKKKSQSRSTTHHSSSPFHTYRAPDTTKLNSRRTFNRENKLKF